MAEVTTPQGKTFEETSPVAIAYYHREPGYIVDGEDRTGASAPDPSLQVLDIGGEGEQQVLDNSGQGEQQVEPDAPPHDNASHEDWIAFATAHGDADAASKGRNQLRDEYKAAHPAT